MPLRSISTFGLESRARASAFKLQDKKFAHEAQSAKHHPACLVQLCKRADSVTDAGDKNEHDICPESIALAELVVSIKDSSESVFKLADLAKAYESRLEQLQRSSSSPINSTWIKKGILTHIPSLKDYNEGRHEKCCLSKWANFLSSSVAS